MIHKKTLLIRLAAAKLVFDPSLKTLWCARLCTYSTMTVFNDGLLMLGFRDGIHEGDGERIV